MKHESLKSNIENVDAVFVVSVKTFNERIAHIQNEFNQANIEFRFVFEYDIPEIDKSILEKYFIPDSHVTMGAKSLVLKNIFIWQACVQHNLKRVLVIEDDAVLVKDFKAKLSTVLDELKNINPGYYIFLGGAQSKIPTDFHLGENAIVPLKGDTTEGYIIDFEACCKLLKWLEINKISLPVDALLNTVSPQIGIQQYWTKTVLVEQGSLWGLFESSLDGKRRKRTKFENMLRYKFVVFKRRTIYRWFYRTRFRLLGY